MTEAERCREKAALHLVRGFYRYFFPRPEFDYDGSDWEANEHFKTGVMYLEMEEVEKKLEARIHACAHPRAVRRCYVGSVETYFFCPDCLHTFGGEETAAKRELISAAGREDPGERGEPDNKEENDGKDSRT